MPWVLAAYRSVTPKMVALGLLSVLSTAEKFHLHGRVQATVLYLPIHSQRGILNLIGQKVLIGPTLTFQFNQIPFDVVRLNASYKLQERFRAFMVTSTMRK